MELNERELRNALGHFATGVCLITTIADDGSPVAMTVNSFGSVSLKPPLVQWSLQNQSDVFPVFSRARQFAVNVLSDKQENLCRRYSRKGSHHLSPEHYEPGQTAVPLIRNALVSLECSLATTHPAGDHLLIIGQVESMHAVPNGDPLVFCGGAFRQLA